MDRESAVHIAAVRKALQNNTAAVMVGAGFSRNAEGGQQLKLWKDLARELWIALNPGAEHGEEFHSSPVTQLASQYAQMFSLPTLEDLLKKHIPDEKVRPGELHRRLLMLNWSDIFTTNYDTLLERAADSIIERAHYTITCREDIPQSKALGRRRIVKLHGSFPSQRPFIFTEEQYRNYPKEFSPFVNLVRQSMLENVFCLIGFSGDDPNFLGWIGWVRDMLDQHALPIYLFISKPMSPAQRKLLEARKVTPVLLPCGANTDESDYEERFRQLLNLLEKTEGEDNSKSWINSIGTIRVGSIEKSTEEITETLLKCLPELFVFKNKYPGWLICPHDIRQEISRKLNPVYNTLKNDEIYVEISSKSPHLAIVTLALYAWIAETLLESLDDSIATKAIELIFRTFKSNIESKDNPSFNFLKELNASSRKGFFTHWNELALRVLRWAREEQDYKRFKTIKNLIEKSPYFSPTMQDEISYETILFSIYAGDLNTASKLIIEWIPTSNENFMEIRKGSLLAEIGETSLGLKACASGLQNLRRGQKISSNSTKLFSEESWAALVIKNIKLSESYGQDYKSTSSNNETLEKEEDHSTLLFSDADYSEDITVSEVQVISREANVNPTERDQITENLETRISELESKGFKAERERDLIIATLDSEVSHRNTSNTTLSHSFDFGRYTVTRSLFRGNNSEHNKKTVAAFAYLKVCDLAALPPIMGDIGMYSESYVQAAWWIQRADCWPRVLSTAMRAMDINIFKARDPKKAPYKSGWLSRYQVGTIEESDASDICKRLLKIVEELLTSNVSDKKKQNPSNNIRIRAIQVRIEVYSRLIIRVIDQALIKEHAERLINIHKSTELWSHSELWKAFGNALFRALEAARPNIKKELLIDILDIPAIPPKKEETSYHKHSIHEWLSTNQLISTYSNIEMKSSPSLSNEAERLITSILKTKDEQVLEKLWARIFLLDNLKLLPSKTAYKLSKTLYSPGIWPAIPGFRKVASIAFFSKNRDLIKRLSEERIPDLSHIPDESEPGRRAWSIASEESNIDCWLYLARKNKLSESDISTFIDNIRLWWKREWHIIKQQMPIAEDILATISNRLYLIDSFLATALPIDWRKNPLFSKHSEWIKTLIEEGQKFDINLWKTQFKHRMRSSNQAYYEDIEVEISSSLLGDPASQQFRNSLNTVREWIRFGWTTEPKTVVDAAITMMSSITPLKTSWGLELVLIMLKAGSLSISKSRFNRIEKGLNLLWEHASYKPKEATYSEFKEDVPLIRYLCCCISLNLAKSENYGHSEIVQKWIAEIPNDPLPEIRHLDQKAAQQPDHH